jgi:hypothetical protein
MSQTLPTQAEVIAHLRHFGKARWDAVREVAHEGENDGIGISLLVAIGLRETWMNNIEGDGGHGKGWLQVDNRAFPAWLKSHAGCKSGSWSFAKGHHAYESGYVPGLTAGTHLAITLLRGNIAGARRARVPAGSRIRVAVAGYNCGLGNALAAYKGGSVDARTTGRDYSHWVLTVQEMVTHAAKDLGWSL